MTRRRAVLALTLPYLFLLCVVVFRIDVSASIEVSDAAAKKERVDGCVECGDYRCPGDLGKCLLGPVADPCECCKIGICARLDGEPCWNSSISTLPLKRRNDGVCATNYICKLRTDLRSEDEPQALCVCMEQGPACGNDNKTYATPCILHEEAMRRRNSTLRLQHLGPCQSRPWILSGGGEKLSSVVGEEVALICEAEGFPIPDIDWQFHAADGSKVLKLPDETFNAKVHVSFGPEPFMRTSWLQIPRTTKDHTGMFECIAKNSLGEANSVSSLVVF